MKLPVLLRTTTSEGVSKKNVKYIYSGYEQSKTTHLSCKAVVLDKKETERRK